MDTETKLIFKSYTAFWVVVLCLLAAFLFFRDACADDTSATSATGVYLTAGIGRTRLDHPSTSEGKPNQWWIQDGVSFVLDEKSHGWEVGVGYRLSKYFSVEGKYHDFGEYHQFAGYISEEDFYDPNDPDLCTAPADSATCRTTWGYGKGIVKGWSIMLIPEYPISRNFSVLLKLGALKHHATYKTYHMARDNQYARTFSESEYDQVAWGGAQGLGFRVGQWTLEHMQYPNALAKVDGKCCSAFTSVRSTMLNYHWSF